mmetsp:Transcript_18509/g.34572  ORF Transcript_18509/g.34572 Transcript_18509/m.34572 type:complete len:98 (+) Transcript_18509:41-334(+)
MSLFVFDNLDESIICQQNISNHGFIRHSTSKRYMNRSDIKLFVPALLFWEDELHAHQLYLHNIPASLYSKAVSLQYLQHLWSSIQQGHAQSSYQAHY